MSEKDILKCELNALKKRHKRALSLLCELCEQCGEKCCEDCEWAESEVTDNG